MTMRVAGWILQSAGLALYLFGYFTTGNARLFDWSAHTPWWIADFLPNAESEIGIAVMLVSLIPMYWPRRTAATEGD